MNWDEDIFLTKLTHQIVDKLKFIHIKKDKIHILKTKSSRTRAYARTWAFPKIFQHALKTDPVYVIEIISKNFDRLNEKQKVQVLIHELMHIPRSFSGNLRPHKYGNKRIDREVSKLFKEFEKL